jgi:hypothetical protein
VVCVCPFVVGDTAMFFCCFVKDVRGGNTQAGYMCRNKEPEVSTVPTYQNVSRQLGSKQKVQIPENMKQRSL